MNFQIDDCYLESVSIIKRYSMYAGRESLTEEELVKVLQGKDICTSHSTADHPEFAKLREQLGEEGYIHIQRGWWNGDSVLKPFTLNGKKFKKNEQFPSGAAMRGHLKFMKK
jgi:hypothetical protein